MKSDSLYISSLEPFSGSLIITMGIMELLKGGLKKVAFFRPIINNTTTKDNDISFMLEKYSLGMEYKETYGFSTHEVEKFIADNQFNNFIELILEKFKKLKQQYDFIVVEGLNNLSFSHTLDFDINLTIAQNLGTPYINILKGKDKNATDIVDEILIENKSIADAKCTHLATFINRIDSKYIKQIKKDIKTKTIKSPVYLLEEVAELDTPTMREIKTHLDCKQIKGEEKDLKRVVKQSKIAAMKLENFLEYIEDGDLIIVPGDRTDIIVGALGALNSDKYPNICGILLTGGFPLHKSVKKLFSSFNKYTIPIFCTKDDTWSTAQKIMNISATITPQSDRKIALAMGLFFKNVDTKYLKNKIIYNVKNKTITPIMFEYNLFQRAMRDKKKIVLLESSDERILRATEILLRRDIVDIVLLGDKKEISAHSKAFGIDISKASFINPQKSPLNDKYVDIFYNLRKAKGLTYQIAKDTLELDSYFGTMMVYCGDADGMVSGAIHTTQDTIRPALQIIKTKPNISIVSSLFFMCFKTKVLVYADCAVNQDPNDKDLAQIAITSSQSAKIFGIKPKVAMLSYSTGDSSNGNDVQKVRDATNLVKKQMPNLLIEGPIQYDAAIDKQVAKIKLPDSKVAGKATIFIFPNLNTGNNTYKAVQRSSNAIAIGPILQGLNKPVNDLSRGCKVDDIVNTIVITAIQAQDK